LIVYNQLQNIHVKLKEIKQLVGKDFFYLFKNLIILFIAINCVRLLTRLLPYIFEEPEWRGFFWSDIPTSQQPQQTTSNGVSR
jgi:hypothetical protein